MLDRNAGIEQVIYTGGGSGGKGKFQRSKNAFGVWGQSRGFDHRANSEEFGEIIGLMRQGHKVVTREGEIISDNYARSIRTGHRLKSDAKPLGFFKRQYKANDYESFNYTFRNEIRIIEESTEGKLAPAGALDHENGNGDFREHPEDAEYRIAYTKFVDGRLFVARLSGINATYDSVEERGGNFFAHAYIFPVGTEIEDIDLNSLDWQYGLDPMYWKGENRAKAPEFLETTSINKMMANKQRKSATSQPQQKSQGGIDRNLSEQELFELYKKSTTEKDFAKKMELKKVFEDHIKRGANLIEIRKLAYMELINAQRSGKDTIDYAIVVEGLENTSCKFDLLFKDFSELSSNTQMGYRESVRLSEQLKDRLSRCDMEVVVKFAESQKEMIDLKRAYERMTSANNRESEYTTKEVDNAHRFVAYCQKVLQSQHQGEMGQ